MKPSLLLFCALLALTGCQSQPAAEPPPAWIDNPGEGAVGSATTHVRGRYYQEELAIARARERLAARYGVRISSVSTISETVRNDTLYVRGDHDIQQIISSHEVKAQVRAMWYDRAGDTVWVWLFPINP